MLQKEVCERVTASPRSGDYGQLTVRLQARWQASIVRHVPPDSFHPRPAVDSAIVSLQPRNRHELPVFDEHLFSHLVRLGFSQRRKQLKNVLGQLPKPWPELCQALKITESARAEELSVAQWIELTRLSDPHPLHDTPQSAGEIFDVVNDQNQVVSQATRAEVHARALKHRAVHIFAFTPSGELLLQKRSHLKDTCPSLWDSSAAGHLDAGESYEAAVTRELHEELGLKPSASTPVFQARLEACPETGWEFVELYAVTISPSRIRFPAAEIEAVRAFPVAMVTAWTAARPQDFAPGFLRC
jgi:16S rRNA (adenine1518-N6/adenine1519-N6)-dimethyltransferase